MNNDSPNQVPLVFRGIIGLVLCAFGRSLALISFAALPSSGALTTSTTVLNRAYFESIRNNARELRWKTEIVAGIGFDR